jgi:UDP-glucose 4-epimerase
VRAPGRLLESNAGIYRSPSTLAERVASTTPRQPGFIPSRDMSTNCLVTGAAGFIGSHLVDALLARGASVVGLDNLKLGRRTNLEAALRNPRCTLHAIDVNDVPAVNRIVSAASADRPFDVVWHLAANSDIRAGVADSDVDLRDTFLTTHSILKVMRDHRIPAIAFASTSAIYGVLPGLMREDAGPLFPISNTP